MKVKRLKIIALGILGAVWANFVLAAPTLWTTVAPGLDYTRVSNFPAFPEGVVHAFRIDLRRYHFEIGLTQFTSQDRLTLPELLQQRKAVIATNGGFFTPQFQPLGLLISQGKQLSLLKTISWWGIFSILNSQAQITTYTAYQPSAKIDFAIQAGPRLLVAGKIPNLHTDIDDRTALGITRNGQIILLVTENLLLSTTALAELMQASKAQGGLDCSDAINLDGGHSSQLYTQLPNFNLQVPSYAPVADAVLVVPNETS